MKKFFLICLFSFLALSSSLNAQSEGEKQPKEPTTKLEQFLGKKGTLIVKDFYRLGKISDNYGAEIKFDALVIYEPGQEIGKARGVKIEITEGGKFERSNSSFLDMDELQSLSEAISYMNDILTKWVGIEKEYTEIIFSTKGDFEIGFYQEGMRATCFSSSGYIGKASCFFKSTNDLLSIKTKIDKAI